MTDALRDRDRAELRRQLAVQQSRADTFDADLGIAWRLIHAHEATIARAEQAIDKAEAEAQSNYTAWQLAEEKLASREWALREIVTQIRRDCDGDGALPWAWYMRWAEEAAARLLPAGSEGLAAYMDSHPEIDAGTVQGFQDIDKGRHKPAGSEGG